MQLVPVFVTHPQLPGVKLRAFVEKGDVSGRQPVKAYMSFNGMIDWLSIRETLKVGWRYNSMSASFAWFPMGLATDKTNEQTVGSRQLDVGGLKVWPTHTTFEVVEADLGAKV